jgi:hypothetical protein
MALHKHPSLLEPVAIFGMSQQPGSYLPVLDLPPDGTELVDSRIVFAWGCVAGVAVIGFLLIYYVINLLYTAFKDKTDRISMDAVALKLAFIKEKEKADKKKLKMLEKEKRANEVKDLAHEGMPGLTQMHDEKDGKQDEKNDAGDQSRMTSYKIKKKLKHFLKRNFQRKHVFEYAVLILKFFQLTSLVLGPAIPWTGSQYARDTIDILFLRPPLYLSNAVFTLVAFLYSILFVIFFSFHMIGAQRRRSRAKQERLIANSTENETLSESDGGNSLETAQSSGNVEVNSAGRVSTMWWNFVCNEGGMFSIDNVYGKSLFGLCLIPVVRGAFDMLSCTYYPLTLQPATLISWPEMKCWVGWHVPFVPIAVLLLCTLTSLTLRFQLIVNNFDPRLRYSPRFLVIQAGCELLVTGATNLVAGVPWPLGGLLVVFFVIVIFGSLSVLNTYWQPCIGDAGLINHLRSSVLAGAAFTAVCGGIAVLVNDVNNPLPIIILLVGLLPVLVFVWLVSVARGKILQVTMRRNILQVTRKSPISKQRQAAHDLGNLALNSDARKTIVKSGMMDILVNVLLCAEHRSVIEESIRAALNLTVFPETTLAIIHSHAILNIVRLLPSEGDLSALDSSRAMPEEMWATHPFLAKSNSTTTPSKMSGTSTRHLSATFSTNKLLPTEVDQSNLSLPLPKKSSAPSSGTMKKSTSRTDGLSRTAGSMEFSKAPSSGSVSSMSASSKSLHKHMSKSSSGEMTRSLSSEMMKHSGSLEKGMSFIPQATLMEDLDMDEGGEDPYTLQWRGDEVLLEKALKVLVASANAGREGRSVVLKSGLLEKLPLLIRQENCNARHKALRLLQLYSASGASRSELIVFGAMESLFFVYDCLRKASQPMVPVSAATVHPSAVHAPLHRRDTTSTTTSKRGSIASIPAPVQIKTTPPLVIAMRKMDQDSRGKEIVSLLFALNNFTRTQEGRRILLQDDTTLLNLIYTANSRREQSKKLARDSLNRLTSNMEVVNKLTEMGRSAGKSTTFLR